MSKKAKTVKQKTEEGVVVKTNEKIGFLKKVLPWRMDVLVVILILVYAVTVWWPTRFLPYHWSSASFVVNAARDLMNRDFSPLLLLEFKTAHQPGLMFLLGLAWKVFGESRFVSHMVMIPSLPILMISTYILGKKIYSQSLGVVASFLVGTLPLAVSEYGMISVDLWMAAVATSALALWVINKKTLGIVFLCLAVLIKGSALLVLVPMFLFSWSKTTSKKEFDFKPFLLPVATLMIWFFYNMSVTGWLFNPPEIPLLWPVSMNMFVRYLVFVSENVFGSHMRYVLSLVGVLGAWLAWQAEKFRGEKFRATRTFLITIVVGVVYLSVRGGFEESFSLFLMPFIVLSSLWLAVDGFEKFEWFGPGSNLVIVGLVFLLISLMQWQPKIEAPRDYVFNRSADLSYQDLIFVGRSAAIFSQVNFPGTKIFGGYPEYYQLTEPYQGYVSKPLDFDTCDHFDFRSEKVVLVYLHPYHPSQQNCRVLLDKYKLDPVQRFESNGAWLEIYAYSATESADLEVTE